MGLLVPMPNQPCELTVVNARVLLQNESGRYFVVGESFLNGTNSGAFTMVNSQGWDSTRFSLDSR